MSITTEFHDPRAKPRAVAEPYELDVDLEKPLTIGLVANGFPDSVRFLDHVEKSLAQVVPTASFVRYDKGDASSVVSGPMLEEIQAECQAVVAAYGHWGSCTSGTVRDSISVARLGIPAIALVTEEFWPQGDFFAQSTGMPEVPRIKLPHPVAGTGEQKMAEVAADITPSIIDFLSGGTN